MSLQDAVVLQLLLSSKSSAPAAADPDSEDESFEPRAYVVHAIQSNLLTSSEGGSHATPVRHYF